jgi:hypothetical protein
VEVLNHRFTPRATSPPRADASHPPTMAGWLIARLEGVQAAEEALHYVAPVGGKDEYVAWALANITPYLADAMITT